MNWNQYRNSGLKVIDLGTRHPKNNWWNGFFRDADIEALVVTESGEAVKAEGLCIVEQVIQWPSYSHKDQCWLVTVEYRKYDQAKHSNYGRCEIGFQDYGEAGQVKKGSLFYN